MNLLNDDCLAFWPMNEGSGAVNQSLVNNTYIAGVWVNPGSNLSWSSAAPWNNLSSGYTGSNGKAVSFSGSGSGTNYIDLGINPYAGVAATCRFQPRIGFSLSAWIQPAARPVSGNATIIADLTQDPWANWRLSLNSSGCVVFDFYQGGAQTLTSSALTNGTPYNVIVTWDLTTWTLYVDGVSVATLSGKNTPETDFPTSHASIGGPSSSSTNYHAFNGLIGPTGVWSRAIADTEIASLCQASNPIPKAITYVLAGFNPGVSNPAWFTSAPTATQLGALWAASALSGVIGARTWATGGVATVTLTSPGNATQCGVDLLTAIKTLVGTTNPATSQKYGTTGTANRAAILIPNATYNFPESNDTTNTICPLGALSTVNCPFLDLIGQSAAGVILETSRGDVNVNCPDGPNNGFSTIMAAGNVLIAHATVLRNAPGKAALMTFTVAGGAVTAAGTVTNGGTGFVAGYRYQVSYDGGSGAYVTCDTVSTGGVFLTGHIEAGDGGSGFSGTGAGSLLLNSHYCVHDDSHIDVNDPAAYFDLNCLNQTNYAGIGTGTSDGAVSYFICINANTGLQAHANSTATSPSLCYYNNCTAGLEPFSPYVGYFASYNSRAFPQYGILWRGLSSTQADQITIIGCTLHGGSVYNGGTGTGYDLDFNDPAGNEILSIDGVNLTGTSLNATYTAGTNKVRAGMGGAILMVTPPIHASQMFAISDPNYAANDSGSLLYGVIVDDVSGSYYPPNTGSVGDQAAQEALVLDTAHFGPADAYAGSATGGSTGTPVSEVTLPNIAAGTTWEIALNPTSALSSLSAITLKKNGNLLTETVDYDTPTIDLTKSLTFVLHATTADGDTLKAQATANFANGATLVKVWNVGVGSTGGGGGDPATIWGYTARTLTGAGGAIGPTAGVAVNDILASVGVGETAPLSALCYTAAGAYATIATTASITYTIYDLCDDSTSGYGAYTPTVVVGHSAVALSPSAVLFDTLQTDGLAQNYNFRHQPSVALGQPFPHAGNYTVQYTFTTTTGTTFYANFKVKACW